MDKVSQSRGCLLGMAVGDAMGYTVDAKTWEEICADYGPNGLLGYDLVNGCAEVSSYTQLGAYVANGLLLAVSRGKAELYPKYIHMAMKEWARRQNLPRDPEKYYCWVSHISSLRRRHCRDSRMLDALRSPSLGTPQAPINKNPTPGSMTAAAMVGLVYDSKRLSVSQIGELGAGAVAATHGGTDAFLSGAVLALIVADIMQSPEKDLKSHFLWAIETMDAQFRMKYSQAAELAAKLKLALAMAEPDQSRQTMEKLMCNSAAECLSGAMYACLCAEGDFDTAMITAVNHSGRSAAVGAMTGAILGAKLGYEALPDFYLEGLEVAPVLDHLAQDMAQGSPTMGLFDDDWDHKYTQGLPLAQFITE